MALSWPFMALRCFQNGGKKKKRFQASFDFNHQLTQDTNKTATRFQHTSQK